MCVLAVALVESAVSETAAELQPSMENVLLVVYGASNICNKFPVLCRTAVLPS